ncbi:MAG: magnesium transporter CorA family protein [Candidatus Pacebacteria bacterium]|nr:magnesium transporter CorA family protein [Candidatus Paceibacterota bacterium]MCF7857361.1 magnesium transporter CorA family protein [Candidatus Paceibacterota bacterium]
MITHYFKTTEDTQLSTCPEPRVGIWTHVVAPKEEELEALSELYGLDETIIKDIEDFFEVPRFEQEGTASYFFTRYPYDLEDIDIDTVPILIVLGETFLITIAEQEVPFLKPFLDGKRIFSTTHKTKLFLEFVSELMITYERKLTRTRKMVLRDTGRVRSIKARDIQRLVFFEQEINETISALVPTHDWLKQLTKGNYIQMFSEDRELLEDLLIANNQLVDSSKSILKTIQNIRGASESILTQKLNSTIRMLTGLTIVLTIPTLISSLFGMNVPLPLQNNPYGFWLIITIIVVAVAFTIYFLRNRWI